MESNCNTNKKIFSMTYDIENFLPDSKLILGEYICHLCKGVYNDPYLATCGHIFCKKCLEIQSEEIGTCPIEQQKISKDSMYTVIFLKNMIDKQNVYCINKQRGCDWQGILSESKNHTDNVCDFMDILCTNEGCEFKSEKMKVKKHELDCGFRKYNCEFCGNKFARNNITI